MKISESFDYQEVKGFKFGYDPFSQPKLCVYIYYIDGLLIDTGQPKMRKEILEKLNLLQVNQIYLTHHHEDHSGNAPALQKQFNCPVYASSPCCEMMKNPPSISFAQHIFWGDRPANFDLIAKDDVIETEKYSFQIIPVPGHAVDMVALYEPKKRWLFTADLYVHHRIKYFMKSESVAQQIDSIKRILELDFDVMLCGHYPQLKNAKPLLKKKLHFFEDFYQKVAELHHQKYSPKAIFQKLQLKEKLTTKILSHGHLSTINMVKAVVRDEKEREV